MWASAAGRAVKAAGLLLFLAWSVSAAQAGPDALRPLATPGFDLLTTQNDLPSDSTYAVARDSLGFMWIGTFDGLARYDAYHMRTFLFSPDTAGGLPDANIRVLAAAPQGGLWVGTGSKGIVYFNPATERFERLKDEPPLLATSRIYGLLPDGGTGVYIAHLEGLAHYDPNRQPHWKHWNKAREPAFGHRAVFSVLKDREGAVWAGGDGGLSVLLPGASGFTRITSRPQPDGLAGLPVWALKEDTAGTIWVGTDGAGIGQVDRNSFSVRPYRPAGRPTATITHTIRRFLQPRPDELWAGTYGAGIFVINLRTGMERHYQAQDRPGALRDNFIRDMAEDGNGMVFAATEQGVAVVNASQQGILSIPVSRQRLSPLDGAAVRAIGADDKDAAWIGYDNGQLQVISDDGTVSGILPGRAQKNRSAELPKTSISAIGGTRDGRVLIGATGLYEGDSVTHTVRRFEQPFLRDHVITSVADTPEADWAGTYAGLARIDRKTDEVRVFDFRPGDPASLPDNNVRDILPDGAGGLWIATRNGLCRFDIQQSTCQTFRAGANQPDGLSNNNLFELVLDDQGALWAGTAGGGINVLADAAKVIRGEAPPRFRILTRRDGLQDETVYSMTKASTGEIWVYGPRGLMSINPLSFAVRNLTGADGIKLASLNVNSAATLGKEALLFPAAGGLTAVIPALVRQAESRAPLALTSLVAGGEPKSAPSLSLDKPILLFPGRRSLSAEFALLDYGAPGIVQYRYRLTGYDRAWTDSTPDKRIATFTNLPPGSFMLEVAARRGPGGDEQVLRVPVISQAEWFERPIFMALGAIGLVGLVILIVQWRTGALRKRQVQLEKDVSDRSQLLTEAALAQERARIDEARANAASQAKTEFIANMSHELRTPLNAIGNYTQLLKEELADSASIEVMSDLESIETANRHLLGVISGVLDLSKIEAGMVELHRETVALDFLLAEVNVLALALSAQNNNHFTMTVTGDPGEIETDVTRLRQSLLNLLGNAFKFCKDGQVDLLVNPLAEEIVFEIRDTGIGMTQEQINRLFVPFAQADSSTTKRFGGTGLGLALTKRFVELMGGSVQLTSEMGKGSVFTIRLPRKMVEIPGARRAV